MLKFGPSLAGILTIALTAGRSGVRDLLHRCVQWRGPVSLYVAAIFLQPLILLLVLVLRGYLRSNQGLVLPILLHGSINASFYAREELLPGVTNASDFQPVFDWWLAGIWCVLALLVATKWHSVFGRSPEQRPQEMPAR
jgi:hypothetical protein